jgi:hypothetical protein
MMRLGIARILGLVVVGGAVAAEGPRHSRPTHPTTYSLGAVCPERGTGAALVLPTFNSEAMQLHLDEIAAKVAPGAHAILILDQAGWHGAKELKIPINISLLPLLPRAPELNSQENIWHSCARISSPTGYSNPSTTSSTTAATPGTPSSTRRGRSCPSPNANEPPSVTHCEGWY